MWRDRRHPRDIHDGGAHSFLLYTSLVLQRQLTEGVLGCEDLLTEGGGGGKALFEGGGWLSYYLMGEAEI